MAEGAGGVIGKAALLLRLLAQDGGGGSRLKDVAEAAGIARPSVHRLLSALCEERLVRRTDAGRYALGPALFELGLIAPNPVGQLDAYRPIVRELALRCGDVVYLSMRRGANMQYLLRDEGAYPIRTYTVNVGELRRMATSYSGLAMLACMHPQAAARMIHGTESDPAEAMRLIRQVARHRDQLAEFGYVGGPDLVLDGVAGIAGLAVPVPNAGDLPYLVLSVSAVVQRLEPARYDDVARSLRAAAQAIADVAAEAT